MGDFAIRAEHLGKLYRIGQRRRPRTIRDALASALSAPLRGTSAGLGGRSVLENSPESDSALWALKDVSFEVKRGEVIGFIGRNGSGKSTLLKILSRITEPTTGQAMIRGRVGSLLEVGTGFHSELTGRENIYLNGAIMGMKKAETDSKFDEIVAFAEVEKFLDTPVKHYSSGMYMRLAFAVAAHLEPDILLVDEALAVGDAAFQKKCLGKMGDVVKEGRTVLFVSHNMHAVQKLCEAAHLLEQGRIVSSGAPITVADEYYRLTAERDEWGAESREIPEGTVRFVSWHVESTTGDQYSCHTGKPCVLKFRLAARRIVKEANFGIALSANDGTLIWAMRSLDYGGECVCLREGMYELQFVVPQFPLRPGTYHILVSANDLREGNLDAWSARPWLQILPQEESGLPSQWQGILNIRGRFTLLPMRDAGAGGELR
jgi:lipopolysaccharide transport system ATP-binding protein